MQLDEPDDPRRRAQRSTADRLQLLEEDGQNHARIIGDMLKAGSSFSPQQLEQLRALMAEAFGNAGLRIDEDEHVDEARRDFMFLRSLRKGLNGTASKIGWAVILAGVGAAMWLFTTGINAWRGGP